MKIDAGLIASELAGVPARAREIEAQGFDGCVSAEIASDPSSRCCSRRSTPRSSS